MFIKSKKPDELAKEMFWLAWQACGGPSGMGFLQDAPNASKEDVWSNIVNKGDYPGNSRSRDNRPYADYVFGRMMKFGVDIKEDGIEVRDMDLRPDYQSWCVKYKTVNDLVEAAQENIK